MENLHVLQNNVKVLIFLERKLMSFHLSTAQKLEELPCFKGFIWRPDDDSAWIKTFNYVKVTFFLEQNCVRMMHFVFILHGFIWKVIVLQEVGKTYFI
jgi:hypothetical protein